jgi:hypothetical protein
LAKLDQAAGDDVMRASMLIGDAARREVLLEIETAMTSIKY